MGDDTPAALGALRVDEGNLKNHVDEVVRSSVEETLNALLDAEADQICGAQRYERSAQRVDGRAGHYERKLETKAGAVTLRVPKLRRLPFETAIIERYKRRESSVEEALVEMYLAGVSVRRVEDITEALWGTRVSSGTVSRLNQKIYRHIEAWRTREIVGEFPYVYLDGLVLKRSWAGEVRNISVLVAIGVGADGHRQILGVAEGAKEDLEGWRGFLRYLADRGLKGVRLIISDACRGLVVRTWLRQPKKSSRRRTGSAVWFTSIATYSATCRTRRWPTWRACSRRSTPRRTHERPARRRRMWSSGCER